MSDIPVNSNASRKLAAILAADIAGYSALMSADEEATVRDLKAHQAVLLPMIGERGGRIIDTAGDGILAEFQSIVNAVKCAPHGPTWTAMCLWQELTRGWAKDRDETLRLACYWAELGVNFEDADGQAHTVLGNVRLLQGRFDEAMEVASEAVIRRPGCPNANGFFANVLLHCGDAVRAIVHARRAIRIMPVYPPLFVEILAAAYRCRPPRAGGHGRA